MKVKRYLHHWPTRMLCFTILVLQAVSLNWFLMTNLSYKWAAMFVADAVVIVFFVNTFLISSRNIRSEKHTNNLDISQFRYMPLVYMSWCIYIVVLDVKVVAIFSTMATDLLETDFFGPNTLKTSIALAAVVFLTYIPTLNDVQYGPRKELIVGLTSTVTVDILDGVDNLEILFDVDLIDSFPRGLCDVILIISCFNFLLPIVPLFILARYRFGLRAPSKIYVVLFRFTIVYLVNFPLFVLRLYIWHGLSRGESMFLLKNMIAIGVITFELFEKLLFQKKEQETNPAVTDAENLSDVV